MSQEVFIRGLFSGLFGLAFAWAVFSRYDAEVGSESTDGERQRYLPYLPSALLPMYLLGLAIVLTALLGVRQAARLTLSMCFGIFLHISAYYLALLLLLPLLRRYISARACAMLWIIPNYLYFTQQSFMALPGPRLVITAPGSWVWILFWVWLAGFSAVLVWKTAEHLAFRRRVLTDSVPVTDPEILAVWQRTIEDARIRKPKFKLVTSPHVKTPLSIGLFRRATRVILPRRGYTQEELELILRHEIVHIGREDAWSKFFLVFCTAMCWFNPLMWVAMGRSAEDLELSCDETVLLGTDEDTRKKYASLLLDTAGDGRGFTTCLSTSARAMRYRLKSVAQPAKRRSGALIVGFTFFVLCMTSGYVALAYGGVSGAEIIYASGDISQYNLRSVTMTDDEYQTTYEVAGQEAFHAYLSGLTLRHIAGNYSFSGGEKEFTYMMDTPKGALALVLYDDAVKLVPLYGEGRTTTTYYVSEGIDWDYLSAVIVARPALNLRLTREGDAFGEDFSARLDVLWKTEGGRRSLAYDSEFPENESHGMFGYDPFHEIELSFSQELSAPCSVMIETWDRSGSYIVTQTDLTRPFVFEPPEYPAHYTVYASFHGQNGALYEAEFRFDIGDIDSM